MGCCLSCIRNIFFINIKKNNSVNDKNIVDTNLKTYNIKKNNSGNDKSIVQTNLKTHNKKTYLDIIKNNYDNNIETDEESYISIRIRLNQKKENYYIKTNNYIEYTNKIVKEINTDKNLLNIKKCENIFILEDEDKSYTKPPSPYISNKIFYEPDYTLSENKRYEFNYKLNKIISKLKKLVEEKRIKHYHKIKNMNKYYM